MPVRDAEGSQNTNCYRGIEITGATTDATFGDRHERHERHGIVINNSFAAHGNDVSQPTATIQRRQAAKSKTSLRCWRKRTQRQKWIFILFIITAVAVVVIVILVTALIKKNNVSKSDQSAHDTSNDLNPSSTQMPSGSLALSSGSAPGSSHTSTPTQSTSAQTTTSPGLDNVTTMTAYTDPDWSGKSTTFTITPQTQCYGLDGTEWTNVISSIKVPDGFRCRLWDSNSCNGDSSPDIYAPGAKGLEFDGRATSFKCYRN